MIKRMIAMLLFFGALAGGVVWFTQLKTRLIGAAMSDMAAMPQTVSTEVVSYADWQSSINAVGTLRAENGADISAEVAGIVDAIEFTSGDDVQAGALLLRLRLNDAPGRLKELVAAADLAQITYQRDVRQLRAQAIPQSTVDTDLANLKAARAQVEQQQAVLDQKAIRAPFAGRLGVRKVDLGQYLNAGTAIVTLQALDPLYIDFNLPQQVLGIVAVGQGVGVSVDSQPGITFRGAILALDSKVDDGTRNVLLRAGVSNPERKLLPGMFATVRVETETTRRLLTVRQTAIVFNPYGSTVFVVSGDKGVVQEQSKAVVSQRFVTTGPTQGDRIAVLSGLKDGEVVVTAGQIKLRNASSVLINNTVQPTADPAPRPPEE